jgi:hypothetical protein
MAQDKEKTIDVTIGSGDNKQTVQITVRRPSSRVLSEAQRISAKVWTDCVRDKIMTKQELKKFMYANGIWSAEKDAEQLALTEKINNLEKQLYIQTKDRKKMKVSEGKQIAIDMRIARINLRDLIAEKMSLENNTAESLADNAKFDYIVARCTYDNNGELVYKTLDDYNNQADDEIAVSAATAMAEMLYSLDKDFEAGLPENKFLVNNKLVNDDLSLINDKGETVDTKGRRINEFGHYINDDGQRVDIDGNLLDENGNYIPSLEYEDDVHAPEAKPKKVTRKSKQAEPELALDSSEE